MVNFISYGNITSSPIGGSYYFGIVAEPLAFSEKALLNTSVFLQFYALQNEIDTSNGFLFGVNEESEVYIELTGKKPVILNVFPSDKSRADTIEIPQELYKKYIANPNYVPLREINAKLPIKSFLKNLGIEQRSSDFFKWQ